MVRPFSFQGIGMSKKIPLNRAGSLLKGDMIGNYVDSQRKKDLRMTSNARRCHRCDKYRSTTGGRMLSGNKVFHCRDCKD